MPKHNEIASGSAKDGNRDEDDQVLCVPTHRPAADRSCQRRPITRPSRMGNGENSELHERASADHATTLGDRRKIPTERTVDRSADVGQREHKRTGAPV